MRVFRLVNNAHDSIDVGASLTRCSDHSNQKLGAGMYFAETREAALQFAATRHGHNYTHLLTCVLKDIESPDLVDLVTEPHLINRSEFKTLPYAQRGPAYAKKHGKKGIVWKAVSGWTEVCLFAEHVPGCVTIEAAEVVAPPPEEGTPDAAR